MNINLHIERLVLEGLPIAQGAGPLVQHAVEAELSRLLADGVSPGLSGGGALPRVPAGAIQLTKDVSAAAIGRQIAQSVYGGIADESRGNTPSPPWVANRVGL